MQMIDKVLRTVNEYDMIKPGDKVTVALSGGADSVALLKSLISLSKQLEISIDAVHLNHNLRGDESDRDENFVRGLCSENDIPLTVFSENILQGAKENHMGTEEYARTRRYALFSEHCEKIGSVLATAHNLNDLAETLIFNITRGCSLNGLCSIAYKRPGVIRPLIEISRNEIEEYLENIGQDYVTDSTNLTDDYTRNKIRHNVLPQLVSINPSFLQAAKRLSKTAGAAEDYIKSSAESLIESDVGADEIAKCNDAVIAEYLRILCKNKLGITPEYSQICMAVEVIRQNGKQAQIHGGNFIYVKNGKIEVGVPSNDEPIPFCTEFNINQTVTPYKIYEFCVISGEELFEKQKINNLLLKNAVDCDKMGNSLIMRSRIAGDEARLKGRHNKSLKKLFNEQKIPVNERNRLGILSNDKNDIIWIERLGVTDKYAVDENTKRALIVKNIKGVKHH